MSCVSSHDGSSDKESLQQYRLSDSHVQQRRVSSSSLRKTDMLDIIDSTRHRDADAWSVAATIDDQESVISGLGGAGAAAASSSSHMGDAADDHAAAHDNEDSMARETSALLEPSLFRADMDGISLGHHHHHHHHANGIADDKRQQQRQQHEHHRRRPTSSIAEFGDDTRSAMSCDEDMHRVVDDDISAPPQPQPSFASMSAPSKSLVELAEENELLCGQVRKLQDAQKHQMEIIENLRSLTGCNEEVYGRALHLSQVSAQELQQWTHDHHSNSRRKHNGGGADSSMMSHITTASSENLFLVSNATSTTSSSCNTVASPPLLPTMLAAAAAPIAHTMRATAAAAAAASPSLHAGYDLLVDPPMLAAAASSRTLTPQLARLAELVTSLIQAMVPATATTTTTTATAHPSVHLEKALFQHIAAAYFTALPFGTENHHVLNLAYDDQLGRFHSTLGPDFAKWYRQQTVHSLLLNPASKEHLQQLRGDMTAALERMLADDPGVSAEHHHHHPAVLIAQHKHTWSEILDRCSVLSLILHSGDADVSVQFVAEGSTYYSDRMAVVGDEVMIDSATTTNMPRHLTVKTAISPLFIDERQTVLLPSRVILN